MSLGGSREQTTLDVTYQFQSSFEFDLSWKVAVWPQYFLSHTNSPHLSLEALREEKKLQESMHLEKWVT